MGERICNDFDLFQDLINFNFSTATFILLHLQKKCFLLKQCFNFVYFIFHSHFSLCFLSDHFHCFSHFLFLVSGRACLEEIGYCCYCRFKRVKVLYRCNIRKLQGAAGGGGGYGKKKVQKK